MVEVQDLVSNDFFTFVIPFLLTFAIVYALLGQANVPKDKNIRIVLAIITGALTLPFAPILKDFLSSLTSTFLVVIGGFLVLLIFIEVFGIKYKKHLGKDKEGKDHWEEQSIFTKYSKTFAVLVIAIAVLVFIQSGGAGLLGFSGGSGGAIGRLFDFITAPLVFFIIVIALMVWWVSTSNKEK